MSGRNLMYPPPIPGGAGPATGGPAFPQAPAVQPDSPSFPRHVTRVRVGSMADSVQSPRGGDLGLGLGRDRYGSMASLDLHHRIPAMPVRPDPQHSSFTALDDMALPAHTYARTKSPEVMVGHPGITFPGKAHKKGYTRKANKSFLADKVNRVADFFGLTNHGEMDSYPLPSHKSFNVLQRDHILRQVKIPQPAREDSREDDDGLSTGRSSSMNGSEMYASGAYGLGDEEASGFKARMRKVGAQMKARSGEAMKKGGGYVHKMMRDHKDTVQLRKYETAEEYFLEMMTECDSNRSGRVSKQEFRRYIDSLQQYMVVSSGLLSTGLMSFRAQRSLFSMVYEDDDDVGGEAGAGGADVPARPKMKRRSSVLGATTESTMKEAKALQSDNVQTLLKFMVVFKDYFKSYRYLDANSFSRLTELQPKSPRNPDPEERLNDLYAGLRLISDMSNERLKIKKKFIWPLMVFYLVWFVAYFAVFNYYAEHCAPIADPKQNYDAEKCSGNTPYLAMGVVGCMILLHSVIAFFALGGLCLKTPWLRFGVWSVLPWRHVSQSMVFLFSFILHTICYATIHYVDKPSFIGVSSDSTIYIRTYWATKLSASVTAILVGCNFVVSHTSHLYKATRSATRWLLREECALSRYPAEVPWFHSKWDRRYLRQQNMSKILKSYKEARTGGNVTLSKTGMPIVNTAPKSLEIGEDEYLDGFELDRVSINSNITAYDIYLLIEEATERKRVRTSAQTSSVLLAGGIALMMALYIGLMPWLYYYFDKNVSPSMFVCSALLPPVVFVNVFSLIFSTLQKGRRFFWLLQYALNLLTIMISTGGASNSKHSRERHSRGLPFMSLTSPGNIEAWYRVRHFLREYFLFEQIMEAEMVLGSVVFLAVLYVIAVVLFVAFLFESVSSQMHSLVTFVMLGGTLIAMAVITMNEGVKLIDCQKKQRHELKMHMLELNFTSASRKYYDLKVSSRSIKRASARNRDTRPRGQMSNAVSSPPLVNISPDSRVARLAMPDVPSFEQNTDMYNADGTVLADAADNHSEGSDCDGADHSQKVLDQKMELAQNGISELIDNMNETDRPLRFLGVDLTPQVYTLIRGYFVAGVTIFVARIGFSF